MVQTDVNEKRYPVNVSPESGNVVASFLADEDEGADALSKMTLKKPPDMPKGRKM